MKPQPVIEMSELRVFFDGTMTEPQLNHPECVAVDAEGNVWCGGEQGEIFRIDGAGSSIDRVASTGGFALGLAFDAADNLFICDLKHKTVFKLSTRTLSLTEFAQPTDGAAIRIPNFPVVDDRRGHLYVSDSYDPSEAGPGIWSFDLATGRGAMWYDKPLRFANGMAWSKAEDALYVAETFAKRIVRIPVRPDGSAGEAELVTEVPAYPDGLALGPDGRLYIACYEPSLIYRWSGGEGGPDGSGKARDGLELLCHDETAHTLCHPTNCAFQGDTLYVANLGRWHITVVPNATRARD